MNLGTKTIELPQLTANLLRDGGCLIDNLFARTSRGQVFHYHAHITGSGLSLSHSPC